MHYKNEDSFSKAYKAQAPSGLYLLYGSEEYLVDVWAKKIKKQVCGDGGAFNFQRFDGRKLDIDALFEATEALPLMAQEKCVLLDDLDTGKLPPNGIEKLTELFSDLNPACVLIVTGRSAFDAKSAAGKKLVALAAEHGTAAELGTRNAAGLTSFLKSIAKKTGCEISPEICKYILTICENDMNSLSCEMAKICAFAGGGEITRRHVDAVAAPKIEARVFDLSKAIFAGNAQRALELLSNLFYLRESPVAVLAALSMSYADMYRARIARDEGVPAAEAMRMFGYKSEYRVQTAFSGRLSATALRKSLLILADCDSKMKSTGLDDKILLEQTVIQLLENRS